MNTGTSTNDKPQVRPRQHWAVRWLLRWMVPAALLAYGTWTFPLAMLGDERKLLPGDLGDSRFNNYILEHFHQYATGKVDSYWDAPFMYPYKNVTALSDNLLGTAPLYSLFRHFGFNRESAYQLWILALFSLNYICCFIALVLWSKRAALSACGAYVFAFGIHMIGQMEHAQVFPKFMVPLAFWFCWQWLNSGRAKHLLWTALAVVYQFYCGVYLGFMLCYGLLFLAIAYGLVDFRRLVRYRPSMHSGRQARWQPFAKGAGVLVLAAILLWPLMQPYLEVSDAIGMRTFAEVQSTIPRPQSYFFTHPGALSWRSLSAHSQFGFPEWWSHFHFMGALPWIAILLVPIVLWKSGTDPVVKKSVAVLGVAFVLSTFFCLRLPTGQAGIGDFTLYEFVFKLPGFSAMRAIDRIINVQAMYFAAIMVMIGAAITTKAWVQAVIGVCLPIAIVIENKVDVNELKRYDKYAAQELVDRVVLDMQLQHDSTATAYAYTPVCGVLPFAEDHNRTIHMHLTAMLAAQRIGVAVVNAYSGNYPGNHMTFWDRQDQRSLDDWCAFNGTSSTGIRIVNNIHRPILRSDTIALLAPNGKYVCVDPSRGDRAFADRASVGNWETYVRVRLSPTECAFVAHTDRFLSAELHRDSALVATTDRLGDMGVFTLEEQPGGSVAIRADNGLYVALDTASLRLVARAAAVDASCLFRFERPEQ